MENEQSFMAFTDLTLGKVYESMGIKLHKRWPRKFKKRFKKGVENSWSRKAFLKYEKDMKPMKEMVWNAMKQQFEQTNPEVVSDYVSYKLR
jgi:hypothetical protein